MPRLIINTGLYQAQTNRPILKTIRYHELSLELCAILICCPLDFYIYLTLFHLIFLLLQNSHPHLRIIKHSLSHLTLILQNIFLCFFKVLQIFWPCYILVCPSPIGLLSEKSRIFLVFLP